MHRKNMKRKAIILSLLFTLSVMSIAYAAFQSNLKIKGTTRITSNWDIRITNVTSGVATGSAENASAPTWNKLTATMEANLYEKGDAMEYDVTITNNGTIDAVLSDIISTPSNNNAVIITYSGYTKGEKLYKKGHEGNEKIVHVKIEYNPEYDGGETSGEANIDFDFTQGSSTPGGEVNSYLLTFNYSENGGTASNAENEYIDEGTVINLEGKTATKQGYTFVGWNTDKDAQTGLSTATMTANTTLYAIFKKDITITYDKDSGVSEIGKQNDTCTIYNKATSCNKQLPSITLSYPNLSEVLGWYDNDTKVGDAGGTYAATNSVTLIAKSKVNPVIRSWSYSASTDFHAEEYRTKITSVVFEDNINVPSGATSWDVSAVSDSGNVIAWVTDNGNGGYVLHIGGDGGVIANTDSSYIFDSFTALTSITFGDNYDTSNATTMESMFGACASLTSLDLSNFDTSNVTNMNGMFATSYIGVDPEGEDSIDSSLTTIIFGDNFDTSNVTTMESMFYECFNLTNLDLSNFDTDNVTSMEMMFASCDSLISLDLSSFDTNNVTNMHGMFAYCSNLKTIYAEDTFVTTNVTDSYQMFYYNSKLVGGNGTAVATKQVYDKTYAKIDKAGQEGYFTDKYMPTFAESGLNPKTVTITYPQGCGTKYTCSYSIDGGADVPVTSTTIDFNVSQSCVVSAKVIHDNITSQSSYNVTMPVIQSWGQLASTDFHAEEYRTKITSVVFEDNINVPSGATSWDVSAISNSGNVIAWVTDDGNNGYVLHIGGEGGVIANADSSNIFEYFTALTSITFGDNFDTGNVTNMVSMFYNCSNLINLNLSGFDTSDVTNMAKMFEGCASLTSLDLSSFDTSNVTDMSFMFSTSYLGEDPDGEDFKDSSLTTIIFGENFDTSNVTAMMGMFSENRSITKLSLCSFDTSNVTNMDNMFSYTFSLKKVLVGPNWTTANATTDNMFYYAGVSEVTQTNNCEAWSADTTAPTCNSSGGSSKWSTNQTITGTCSDEEGGSGCEKTTVSKNYTKGSTAKGTTTGNYSPGEVCDNGGNCTTCPTQQVKVTGYTMSDYQTGAQVHYDGKASKPSRTTWADQSSTTKRNGTLVNATAGTNFVTFNGTSSYVRIAQLNYTAVTLEAVFKPTKLQTSDIISNIEGGGYVLYMNASGGTTMQAYKSSAYQHPGVTTVANNEIHYAGGSANASMVKAYVDGTLKSKTVSGAIGTTGGSTYVVLGGNPSGNAATGDYFKGNIYAVRIYSSVLTDDQLQKHYVIDKARFGF